MNMTRFLTGCLLCMLASWVSAQQLAKCKQADGTYAFQDTPCKSSSAQTVLKYDNRGNVKEYHAPKPTTTSTDNAAANAGIGAVDASATSAASVMASAAGVAMGASAAASADPVAVAPDSRDEPRKSGGAGDTGAAILLILVCLASLVGWIWLLVVAFRHSALLGIAAFLFPVLLLVVVFLHWDEARIPAALTFGPIVVMLLLGIFLGMPAYKKYTEKHRASVSRVMPATRHLA